MDLNKIPDRMKVWFTPQMLAPDDWLWQELIRLVKEYDDGVARNFTVGEMDEIFRNSDKLQAELWRRHVLENLESAK